MKKNISLSRLLDFFVIIFTPEKSFYKLAIIYGLAISLFTLAVPFSVQILITTLVNTALFQSVVVLSIFLFAVLLIYATLTALQHYVMELFQRHFFARIVSEITLRFLHADPASTPNRHLIANRYFEIMTVQNKLPVLLMGGFSLFLQTTVGLALTSSYHPALLVFNVIFVLCMYGAWRWFSRAAIRGAIGLSGEKYRTAEWLEELSDSDLAAATPESNARCIHHSDQMIHSYMKARRGYFMPAYRQHIVLLLLYACSSAGLLYTCGYLVISGEMTLGQLVAAELVLSGIFMGLSKAGEYLAYYYDLCAAVDKLSRFFQIPVVGVAENEAHTEIATIAFNREGFSVFETLKKPRITRVIAYMVVTTLLFLATFFAVTPWIQTAPGVGRITALNPADRAQSINSLVKGRISKWYVADGTRVKQNDPIVEILDNDPQLLARFESERDAIAHKLETSQLAADTAELNHDRQLKLSQSGLSSRKDAEQALIRWKQLKADVAQVKAELNKVEVQLARQHTQIVRAPRDGFVLHILAGGISTQVKEGDTLAMFVPENVETAAELYVNGLDVPLIHPGRKVRLIFEGWPAVQFSGWPSVAVGTFAGEVIAVDSVISPNGKFRVLVTPTKEEPWPGPRFLRMGANAKGWVLLNEVSVGYELWRQMNSFPPLFDKPPSHERSFEGDAKKKNDSAATTAGQ